MLLDVVLLPVGASGSLKDLVLKLMKQLKVLAVAYEVLGKYVGVCMN